MHNPSRFFYYYSNVMTAHTGVQFSILLLPILLFLIFFPLFIILYFHAFIINVFSCVCSIEKTLSRTNTRLFNFLRYSFFKHINFFPSYKPSSLFLPFSLIFLVCAV